MSLPCGIKVAVKDKNDPYPVKTDKITQGFSGKFRFQFNHRPGTGEYSLPGCLKFVFAVTTDDTDGIKRKFSHNLQIKNYPGKFRGKKYQFLLIARELRQAVIVETGIARVFGGTVSFDDPAGHEDHQIGLL